MAYLSNRKWDEHWGKEDEVGELGGYQKGGAEKALEREPRTGSLWATLGAGTSKCH